MKQLPQGWINCHLFEISEVVTGKTPSKKNDEYFNGAIPFIKPGDVRNQGVIESTEETLTEIGADMVTCIPPDSITVTCIGNLGRAAITKVLSTTNQQINSVIPNENISTKFLYYYLRTIKNWMESEASSTTVTIINKGRFLKAPVILPPVNEQIRIADKLDSVLAKVDAAQARLEKIPTLLKRFRQSVLAAATSGELTREWRDINGMSPNEWSWKKLSDIAEIQGGITKDSKKQSDEDEEIPYLRVANVQRGYLDLAEIKTIRIPSSKLEKLLLQAGDVLFNEGGDLDKLGRGWVWEDQISRCSFQNHVFRARLYEFNNSPKYVSWWGNTEGHEYFIRQGKQTTNLASINKTILSNLPINMPPAEEQKEIVRRIESLFAQADVVEKQYLAAKQRLDRLTQSLLAKAFRGELVPQDPNDESAAELLKRIQAERQAQAPAKRNRKQPA
jgi:type I restriction enzyme S subunit